MSRRRKMNRKASKKSFRKNSGTHVRNVLQNTPRGGIRL